MPQQPPPSPPPVPTVKHTVKVGHASSPQTLEVNIAEGDLKPWDLDSKLRLVKGRHPRLDGPAKVTGRAKYTFDINLPGMDGYELAKRLREQDPAHPPVLATVTGRNDPDHLDRAAEAGFDLHFAKPADPIEVAEQLGDCVRK